MTASPDNSRNDRPKSMITRLFSPRASESSQSESATSITERNMMSEKNRLRTISRNVLSAILNMIEKMKLFILEIILLLEIGILDDIHIIDVILPQLFC
jgi:hypothetical protein